MHPDRGRICSLQLAVRTSILENVNAQEWNLHKVEFMEDLDQQCLHQADAA